LINKNITKYCYLTYLPMIALMALFVLEKEPLERELG